MAATGTPQEASALSMEDAAAVGIQTAAVAAQQVALTEEEIKLSERRVALENQEAQLAAHLEEKRQKLVQLGELAQTERTALEKERLAHEQTVSKISNDRLRFNTFY